MSNVILEVNVRKQPPVRFVGMQPNFRLWGMMLLDTTFPRYELYRGFPAAANLIFELDHNNWARYAAKPYCDDCVVWITFGDGTAVKVGYYYKTYVDSVNCNDCKDINPSYTYRELATSLDKVFSKEDPEYDN